MIESLGPSPDQPNKTANIYLKFIELILSGKYRIEIVPQKVTTYKS